MQITHAFSNTVGDATGTITIWNGATTSTVPATAVPRPSDWNSQHALQFTLAGNTTNASTVSGTAVPFRGAGGVSVGGSAGSLVISGPGALPPRYQVEVIPGERMTTVAALSATAYSNRPLFQPFWMDGTGLQPNTARFMMSFGASSNRSLIGTFIIGVYSAANSTQMTLLASDSASFSSTATASSASWNGVAWFDFTGMSNTTFNAEGRYALAFMVRPNAADVSNMPVSLYGADPIPVVSRMFSNNATSAMNATYQMVPFYGAYSTTTASMPGTVALSQINGGSSVSAVEYWAALRQV